MADNNYTIYMKDGTKMDFPRVIGLQMLDHAVGTVTGLYPDGRKRRIPVADIKFIDEPARGDFGGQPIDKSETKTKP